jgi:hypothetical protein
MTKPKGGNRKHRQLLAPTLPICGMPIEDTASKTKSRPDATKTVRRVMKVIALG